MTNKRKIIGITTGLLLFILFSVSTFCLAVQSAIADEGDRQSNQISYKYEGNKLKITGDDFFLSWLTESDMESAIEEVEKSGATKADVKEINIERVNYVKSYTLCDFANLEKITIELCESTVTNVYPNSIVNNPKLKYISIEDCDFHLDEKDKCIYNNPSLREVHLDCYDRGSRVWDVPEEQIINAIEGNKLVGNDAFKVFANFHWSEETSRRSPDHRWIYHVRERQYEKHPVMRYSNDEESYQWVLVKEEHHENDNKNKSTNNTKINNEQYGHVDFWFNRAGNGVMEIEGANVEQTVLTEMDLRNGLDVELKNHNVGRDAIKKLIIWQVNGFASDVLSGFNNLEEIYVKRCKSSMTSFSGNTIRNNPKLNKIYIEDFVKDNDDEVVISKCPELQEIIFDYENHLKDCKKYTNDYSLKHVIEPSCEDPSKKQPVRVKFDVHGDDLYRHTFDWELCYDKILDKDLWYWFDRKTTSEPNYTKLSRLRRTKTYQNEIESTNCKNVFLVDTTSNSRYTNSINKFNVIDNFNYHVRGFIADGALKNSVQFFVNLDTKTLQVKCFGNDVALEAKKFDTAKQDWDFTTPMSFSNGQTIKLSDYIQKIELDGKLRYINQFTFANLNKLEDVSIIGNNLQNPIDLKTNSFANCGLDNQKFDIKDIKTHIINFHLAKWWMAIGFNFSACNGGAKPLCVE